MQIGFITSEYPYLENTSPIGGIGTFTKNLATLLAQQGHKVFVLIPSQEKDETFVEFGVQIYKIALKKVKGFTWFFNRLYFNQRVNSIIKKEKIQVIEAPEWTGFTAFMEFKCPLVIRLHGSDTYFCNLENRPLKKKNYLFEKAALQGATAIVGVSNFVAKETQQLFSLKKTIQVIHNAVDVTYFKPNHTHIIPNSILYFGTLVRKKGVLEIPKMLNELHKINSNFEMTFVGRDTVDYFTNQSTKELIMLELTSEVCNKVRFLEAVPYETIQETIKQTQVVVLPSFAEAFPMTWLEAMAMEKAMVTSNIGWANELMIDGITGYMVNPEDSVLFANCVNNLLMDIDRNFEMGKNARERIESMFNAQKMIHENEKFYQSLIL